MKLILTCRQISTFVYSVPSGVPQILEAVFIQLTEVSLSWREVPCVQQNGPITGYVVRYYATCGTDRNVQQSQSVETTDTTITGLTPITEYAFQVAAVNVNGNGPFTEPITLGGKCILNIFGTCMVIHIPSHSSTADEGCMIMTNCVLCIG